MNKKLKLFIPCYYAFFANGMMALVLGSVLSYLMAEANINYSMAGGLLSTFAIGNLLASFVNPVVEKILGKKMTSVALSALIPISLGVITMLPPIGILYIACILLGIGRGTVSITNNRIVNDYDGTPAALNLLHTIFAVGAFLAPFLTSLFIGNGFNWRCIVYTVMIMCFISTLGYLLMPLNEEEEKKIVEQTIDERAKGSKQEKGIFFKQIDFYIIGGILFFYLGTENCVNGWFVTYFKDTGMMSDAYATNLVSVTWIMIMLGRLTTASLSKKISGQWLILINCIGTAGFFLLLMTSSNLISVTLAEIGLGFFFAGIYPTCVANAGKYIKGSTTGMSTLLAIAALGGIITPQIIGVVADVIDMSGALIFLSINVSLMLLLAILNFLRNRAKVS